MRMTLTSHATLAVACLVAACADGPTTPTSGLPAPEPEMAAVLDDLAMQAASMGDDEAAAAYASSALALRFGVEPSELVVSVNGTDTRYLGVVTAIAAPGSATSAGIRSLVAWTTNGAPSAFLQVDSRSDLASFDPSGRPTGPGLARGIWADLTARDRFVAVEGEVGNSMTSLAGRCPLQPSGTDPRVICQLARFSIRLGGAFVSHSRPEERAVITLGPEGVNGALIRRADGGDPIRGPVAQPGRPVTGI